MPEVPSALLFLIFRAFIRVEKIEEEVRFCLVHALDRAFAVDLAHAADDLLDDSLGDHLVAGEDRRAETDMIHTGEQRDEASVFFRILERGYTICVLLRACPKKESWKAIHQLFLQQRLKAPGLSRLITKEQHDKACLSFLSATNDLIAQNLMDRLIIKSPKGLLYDSDDMPTERVSELLAKRMTK